MQIGGIIEGKKQGVSKPGYTLRSELHNISPSSGMFESIICSRRFPFGGINLRRVPISLPLKLCYCVLFWKWLILGSANDPQIRISQRNNKRASKSAWNFGFVLTNQKPSRTKLQFCCRGEVPEKMFIWWFEIGDTMNHLPVIGRNCIYSYTYIHINIYIYIHQVSPIKRSSFNFPAFKGWPSANVAEYQAPKT